MDLGHIALMILCVFFLTFWIIQIHRASKLDSFASHRSWQAVRVCQILIAERGGGSERAKKMAKDFCRYTPPEVVIESIIETGANLLDLDTRI